MTLLTNASINLRVDIRDEGTSIFLERLGNGLSGPIDIGQASVKARPEDPRETLRFLFDGLSQCYDYAGATLWDARLVGVDDNTPIRSGTYRAELTIGS